MDEQILARIAIIATYDCVVLLCFAGLSIYFGKWWIILFSVLCLIKYNDNEDDLEEENKTC